MKRFTSYLLACMVGAFGLYGCGGAETEETAMEEAATEEMAADVAMINVEVSSISEEFAKHQYERHERSVDGSRFRLGRLDFDNP